MKKEYIAPGIFCMAFTTSTIICASKVKTKLVDDDYEEITSDSQMLSRRSVWGDDEE